MAVGGVNVEVKGMAELESALQGLTTKLQKETSVKALRAGGRLIRDAWKSKVPREPRYWPEEQKMIAGAYRRSIGLRTKRTATGAEGMVRTTLWYARYVEQGTSRMSARNYAEEGLEASREAAMKAIEETLARACAEARR